jgi:hypothetical protein
VREADRRGRLFRAAKSHVAPRAERSFDSDRWE